MNTMRSFQGTLSALRHEKNISQRMAAESLGISQALLSHYENGAREPGLDFVRRACDYYGVTADYLLCRSDEPHAGDLSTARALLAQVRSMLDRADMALDDVEGDLA